MNSLNEVPNYNIKLTDRVAFYGKTGSGKTLLAMSFSLMFPRIIIVDTKRDLSGWNTENYSSKTAKLLSKDSFRIRVMNLNDTYNLINFILAKHIDCVVIIDEIVNMRNDDTDCLERLWKTGRGLGIGAWGLSQRPKAIPVFYTSEAEHFFIFRLNMRDDRKRVSEYTKEVVTDITLKNHSFLYYNSNSEILVKYNNGLNLRID